MELSDLKKGMIVEVDNITEGSNGYLYATFLRESPESRFGITEAFHQLMRGYANNEVYNPKEEKEELENAVSMNPVYVAELMGIIDAKATLEEDNIKAYNYLNFCRLLAIMLDSKGARQLITTVVLPCWNSSTTCCTGQGGYKENQSYRRDRTGTL